MNPSVAVAGVYVGQLWIKALLACQMRHREPPAAAGELGRITVIQPITSGDEALHENLWTNVGELPGAHFVWVLDRWDTEAHDICRAIMGRAPAADIRILELDEPPAGCNPKLWKQAAAMPLIATDLVAIIDDDTRVPRPSMDALIAAIDGGADLATGLPCYEPARGGWSSLVAEFVNSAAILTYLPAACCAGPRSINGMCYLLRSEYVRRADLFTATGRAITDDLAIARLVRQRSGRIRQTTRPQYIRTTVRSWRHYRRLMHRWFVFIRLLVQNESAVVRLLLPVVFGLPPLLLLGLVIMAVLPGQAALWSLAIVVVLRSLTLAGLNLAFTRRPRHSPLASLVPELLQPVFFAVAWVNPVIWWRHRQIRVRAFDAFEYLSS